MRKTIYISGKMTGLPDYNWPKFDEVENDLLNQGHIVVNPANIARGLCVPDHLTEEEKWQMYIDEDLKHLGRCTTIFMLQGWENSRGANIEYNMALDMGLEVIHETFKGDNL